MRNDLHVPGIWLKNFLTWKKRLLIRTVFVLIDLKTDRSTWSSIAQKARVSFVAYICMCQRYLLQNRRLWDGVKHRNETEHSSSWNKYTPSYLVRVRKYSRKSVALCFGFYGERVQLHMKFYAQNQKSSRICDQLVVNFEPCNDQLFYKLSLSYSHCN